MSMGKGKPAHMGNGLWMLDDGYQIELYVEREGGIHQIFLEPEVFANVVMQGFRIMDAKTFAAVLRKSADHIEAMASVKSD